MTGESGVADATPNLTESQLAGHNCVWCNNHSRNSDRPLVSIRGVANPWGGRIAVHGGDGVTCRDWVTADWLTRHPDIRRQ